MNGFRFSLGDLIRDKVTGFEGICVGRANHISGCDTYGVQPRGLKDGNAIEHKWYDDPRLELVTAGALTGIDPREARTGADSTPTATRSVR
jgi:hypothetical protein